jgi:hypothetical protein
MATNGIVGRVRERERERNLHTTVQAKLERLPLLEKQSIVTPWIHYWYRLVTVADTNIGELTS